MGLLVACWVPPDVAGLLALPGGEPAEQLHLTLAYLGDVADDATVQRCLDVVDQVSRTRGPLVGTVGGLGRFTGNMTSDGRDVLYASYDCPDLPGFRQMLVGALERAGLAVKMEHGYTPHVTLAYIAPDAPLPVHRQETVPMTFEALTVADDDAHYTFPLTAELVLQEAKRPLVRQEEDGRWHLYGADDILIDTFDTEAEALDAMQQMATAGKTRKSVGLITDRLRSAAALTEAAVTSASLEERPFLVDGVPLSDAQVRRLANLVAGRGRPGGGHPMELVEAIDTWRRQNHTYTLPNGRQAWKVHSASPTFREAICESVLELRRPTDSTGKVWEVAVIREGWSSNRKFYGRPCLESALPLFEGADICTYGWDPVDGGRAHAARAARAYVPGGTFPVNSIGRLTNPRGVVERDHDGRDRYVVLADCHLYDPAIRTRIVEAWEAGDTTFMGFSIDGAGEVEVGIAEGQRGMIVRSLEHIFEVTLVKKPSAGGAFRRIVAGEDITKEETQMNLRQVMEKFMRARLKAKKLPEGIVASMADASLQEAVLTGVQEMCSDKAILTAVKALVDSGNAEAASQVLDALIADAGGDVEDEPAVDAGTDNPMGMPVMEALNEAKRLVEEMKRTSTQALQEATEQRREAQKIACASMLRDELGGSKLPKIAVDKLTKQFDGQVFTREGLQEAIEGERTYLAAFATPGVNLPGTGRYVNASVGSEPLDRLQRQMDQIFGMDEYADKLPEKEREAYRAARVRRPSLRDLYLQVTGDEDFTGRIDRAHLQEATTADLPNIFGTSMTRVLMADYQTYEPLYQDLCIVNRNIQNFKVQDRNRLGGFGRLAAVSEGGTYPDAGVPREEKSTYAVAKRGLSAQLTIEMMANDDLEALQRWPRLLSEAAFNELHYYFFALLRGNVGGGGVNTDTIYDGGVIYSGGHGNLGASALDFASLDAARLRMQKQKKFGNSTLLNGSHNDSTTTLTVDSTNGLRTGDVVKAGAEYILVGTVASATSITGCTRGHWGSTAASHADDSRIYQIAGPVPLRKYSLWVPEDLETAVDELMMSEKKPATMNNELNKFYAQAQNGALKKIVVPSVFVDGDTNNWGLVRDPREIAGVELGFFMGKEQPEVLLQDSPTVGNVFDKDQLTYKLRHIYNGVILDEKGVDYSIV